MKVYKPYWKISALIHHYMHRYATLSRGGSNESHKNVKATQSWLLYQYYHSKVCCAKPLFA